MDTVPMTRYAWILALPWAIHQSTWTTKDCKNPKSAVYEVRYQNMYVDKNCCPEAKGACEDIADSYNAAHERRTKKPYDKLSREEAIDLLESRDAVERMKKNRFAGEAKEAAEEINLDFSGSPHPCKHDPRMTCGSWNWETLDPKAKAFQ